MGTFQDESTRQLWAHLNLHNVLLKVVYIELLAQVPEAEAERFAERVKGNLHSISAPADVDPEALDDDALLMFQNAQYLAEHFFSQALAKAAERRGQ